MGSREAAREQFSRTHLSCAVQSPKRRGVFAVLIAGIGCQRGFEVRGGAEAVGSATTSAVVAAIFLIIVTDSAFALVFQYLNI